MAGEDPQQAEERQIETAEQERRRLEDVPAAHDRDGLDHVRRAMREHDAQSQPDPPR
jgi:hypothetical protein